MTSHSWDAALLDWRTRKDAYFASGRGPVPVGYGPLSYYPPNPAWNLSLPVERVPAEVLEVGTSSGDMQRFVRYGYAQLPSGERLLLLTRPDDAAPEGVFVPFRDATSGKTTYGAGRYLDAQLLKVEAGNMVQLDFNRAYHPYCAYTEGYTCPLPPAENWLRVAVEAGERLKT